MMIEYYNEINVKYIELAEKVLLRVNRSTSASPSHNIMLVFYTRKCNFIKTEK